MKHLRALIAAAALCGAIAQPAGADEGRFDVAVTDAPARAFFQGLADGTPYNIVLQPGVGGTVTLKMKNVTLVEVLDAMRETYGYDYHRLSSGFVIDPPALQTRLFQVSYIDLERRGTSRTRVASGQVGQSSSAQLQSPSTPGADGQSQGLSEPPGSIFAGPGDGKEGHVKEITGTSISTRSSSDFWPELEVSLRALIGTEGGRTVVVNAESGLVAVRASPRELRDVQEYLVKIQQIATQQVIIEAKIVEVTLSNAFQAGINWAAIAKNGNGTFTAFQTGPQQGFPLPGLSGNNLNLLNQPSVAVPITPGSNPITGAVTDTLGGAFALAVNTGSFASYVEALSTQGKTTVLSSPRVSTLNNQKAVIKAGDDEYFVTGVTSSVLGVGTVGSQTSNLDLAPFFSGVALDVTPQLSEGGQIILHIHPTVSNVTPKILNVTANGNANSLPLAYSEVREADSVVKAMSGQLIVIGGLMQVSKATQDYAVPGLSSIPLLGNLFRSQQKIKQRSELVILLRPIVVDADGQWAKVAGEEIDHAAALDPKIRGPIAQ